MRQRGAAEAGMKFVSDSRAPNLRTAFEDQRLISRLGQVERGDQAVVAATNDDDVLGFGHELIEQGLIE
jgi:hypothetical protein